MTKTFNCPSCSGPLEYSADAGQVVQCKFCGQSVMVPHLRGRDAAPAAGGRRLVVLMATLGVALTGLLAFWLIPSETPTPPSFAPPVSTNPLPSAPAPLPLAPATNDAFRIVRAFGKEGIGPGHFEDARHIALDGAGNLYVGEYSGGRIQRFDTTGRFLSQWNADPDMPMRGLAADRNGVVYVVQRGNLNRYDGATGNTLGAWRGPSGFRFDGVYPKPDGGILAYGSEGIDGAIVHFDAQGNVQVAFQTQPRDIIAAMDGAGNTYALGRFSERGKLDEAVFKYGPDGTFINRFGTSGDEPGTFRAPHGIAVDGRGRVFVSDIRGLHVFSPDGRFLERLGVGGSVFGFTFNDEDELYLIERNANEVRKLILNLD